MKKRRKKNVNVKCERKLSMEKQPNGKNTFFSVFVSFYHIASHIDNNPTQTTTTGCAHRVREIFFFVFCFPWRMFCESQTGCSTRSGDHISRQMVCVAQTVKCNTQQINSNNQFYECECGCPNAACISYSSCFAHDFFLRCFLTHCVLVSGSACGCV